MNSNFNPDIGGGRGYSISFADQDSYASVQNYFTPSNQWAVEAMTVSVWLRWIGLSSGGTASYPFNVIAANDPNHFQLGFHVVLNENNWVPNVQLFIAESISFTPLLPNLNSFSSCWTHVTMTFNLTGMWNHLVHE